MKFDVIFVNVKYKSHYTFRCKVILAPFWLTLSCICLLDSRNVITCLHLKMKRDTWKELFCTVCIFYVNLVKIWTDNKNISWLLVYDNVFCTLIFQIPPTMSGRLGSKFTQTKFSLICNSWTTSWCSSKTIQGDSNMHFIAVSTN